jgi:hypothetical protein
MATIAPPNTDLRRAKADADGVEVVTRPDGRKSLVATRSFDVGDVVLAELPLITWTAGDSDPSGSIAFLRCFVGAPPETQAAILEMDHPSPTDPARRIQARKREAAAIAAHPTFRRSLGLDAVQIHALLLISDANSFSFAGGLPADEGMLEVVGSTPVLIKPSALFAVAAAARHCCRPNCFFSTRLGGRLRLIAVRPIAPGDDVYLSFLEELYTTPRAERRAKLLDMRQLACRCERCTGLDDCRGLRCRSPGCSGVAYQADLPAYGGDGLWHCGACGLKHEEADMAKPLRVEANLVARLEVMQPRLADGAFLARGPAQLEELIQFADTRLSPAHYLAARWQGVLSAWCAGQRPVVRQLLTLTGSKRIPAPWTKGGSITEAWCCAMAGVSAARGLQVAECVAAGCPAGARCTAEHPPLLEGASKALWIVQDIVASGIAGLRPIANRVGARYRVLQELIFGAEDADVQQSQALIARAARKKGKGAPLPALAGHMPAAAAGVSASAGAGADLGGPVDAARAAEDAGIEAAIAALRTEPAKKGGSDALRCDFAECPQAGSDCSTVKFMRCGGCHRATYCSAACQTEDWPHHKKPCKASRAYAEPSAGTPADVGASAAATATTSGASRK